jgi:hypothetical protein
MNRRTTAGALLVVGLVLVVSGLVLYALTIWRDGSAA